MKIADAISQRILFLCKENDISINKTAILSGQTKSTLQSLINGKSKNPKMLTIVRIYNNLEMSLSELFNDDLFKDIDIEL